jgi:hypothetical protein
MSDPLSLKAAQLARLVDDLEAARSLIYAEFDRQGGHDQDPIQAVIDALNRAIDSGLADED